MGTKDPVCRHWVPVHKLGTRHQVRTEMGVSLLVNEGKGGSRLMVTAGKMFLALEKQYGNISG